MFEDVLQIGMELLKNAAFVVVFFLVVGSLCNHVRKRGILAWQTTVVVNSVGGLLILYFDFLYWFFVLRPLSFSFWFLL